jgi:hypothetical protein
MGLDNRAVQHNAAGSYLGGDPALLVADEKSSS